jgi:arabinogalactan oligomer/maltooligosaccharide transport system substrate-binding protein
MKANRLTWTLCLLVAASFLLPALSVAQTELVVWHSYRGAEKEAFEKVIAAFMEAKKAEGITATTLAVPYDAFADKITAAVPRGKGPDVFIYAQDRLGGWVEAGRTIDPIDFYLDEEITDRFIPTTLEAMTYQGTIYGLPLNYKVIAQFYNKDVVQEPPRTTGELVKVAGGLTDQAAGRFGLAYWYSDFYYHATLMNAFGGGVFAEGRQPVLNRPENVKSLELLMKWFDADKILPAEPSTALITNLFNQGRAGIVFSGPWFLGEIAEGVNFGLSLLPTVDEAGGQPMRPWMTVEGVYIAEPSEHKDEAFELINYLTDVQAAKVMAVEGRQTPANKSVYDDPEVAGDEILNTFRQQVEVAIPMPNYAEMAMVWSPATTAMASVVRKTASPQAALNTAQEEVIKRIESLRK